MLQDNNIFLFNNIICFKFELLEIIDIKDARLINPNHQFRDYGKM